MEWTGLVFNGLLGILGVTNKIQLGARGPPFNKLRQQTKHGAGTKNKKLTKEDSVE